MQFKKSEHYSNPTLGRRVPSMEPRQHVQHIQLGENSLKSEDQGSDAYKLEKKSLVRSLTNHSAWVRSFITKTQGVLGQKEYSKFEVYSMLNQLGSGSESQIHDIVRLLTALIKQADAKATAVEHSLHSLKSHSERLRSSRLKPADPKETSREEQASHETIKRLLLILGFNEPELLIGLGSDTIEKEVFNKIHGVRTHQSGSFFAKSNGKHEGKNSDIFKHDLSRENTEGLNSGGTSSNNPQLSFDKNLKPGETRGKDSRNSESNFDGNEELINLKRKLFEEEERNKSYELKLRTMEDDMERSMKESEVRLSEIRLKLKVSEQESKGATGNLELKIAKMAKDLDSQRTQFEEGLRMERNEHNSKVSDLNNVWREQEKASQKKVQVLEGKIELLENLKRESELILESVRKERELKSKEVEEVIHELALVQRARESELALAQGELQEKLEKEFRKELVGLLAAERAKVEKEMGEQMEEAVKEWLGKWKGLESKFEAQREETVKERSARLKLEDERRARELEVDGIRRGLEKEKAEYHAKKHSLDDDFRTLRILEENLDVREEDLLKKDRLLNDSSRQIENIQKELWINQAFIDEKNALITQLELDNETLSMKLKDALNSQTERKFSTGEEFEVDEQAGSEAGQVERRVMGKTPSSLECDSGPQGPHCDDEAGEREEQAKESAMILQQLRDDIAIAGVRLRETQAELKKSNDELATLEGQIIESDHKLNASVSEHESFNFQIAELRSTLERLQSTKEDGFVKTSIIDNQKEPRAEDEVVSQSRTGRSDQALLHSSASNDRVSSETMNQESGNFNGKSQGNQIKSPEKDTRGEGVILEQAKQVLSNPGPSQHLALENISEEILTRQSRLKDLALSIQDAELTLTVLEQKILQGRLDTDMLTTSRGKLNELAKEKSAMIKALGDKETDLQEEVARLSEQKAALKKECKELNEAINQQRTFVDELTSLIQEKCLEEGSWQSKIEEQKRTFDRLELELQTQSKQGSEALLENSGSEQDELKRSKIDEIEEMEQKLTVDLLNLSEQEERLKDKERSLTVGAEELSKRELTLERRFEELEKARADFKDSETNLEILRREILKDSQKVEDLEKLLQVAHEDVGRENSKRREIEERMKTLAEEASQLNGECSRLKVQMGGLQQDLSASLGEISKLTKENATLNHFVQEQASRNDQLKIDKERVSLELSDIQKKINKMLKVDEDNSRLKEESSDLRGQLEAVHKKHCDELDHLRGTHHLLINQLEENFGKKLKEINQKLQIALQISEQTQLSNLALQKEITELRSPHNALTVESQVLADKEDLSKAEHTTIMNKDGEHESNPMKAKNGSSLGSEVKQDEMEGQPSDPTDRDDQMNLDEDWAGSEDEVKEVAKENKAGKNSAVEREEGQRTGNNGLASEVSKDPKESDRSERRTDKSQKSRGGKGGKNQRQTKEENQSRKGNVEYYVLKDGREGAEQRGSTGNNKAGHPQQHKERFSEDKASGNQQKTTASVKQQANEPLSNPVDLQTNKSTANQRTGSNVSSSSKQKEKPVTFYVLKESSQTDSAKKASEVFSPDFQKPIAQPLFQTSPRYNLNYQAQSPSSLKSPNTRDGLRESVSSRDGKNKGKNKDRNQTEYYVRKDNIVSVKMPTDLVSSEKPFKDQDHNLWQSHGSQDVFYSKVESNQGSNRHNHMSEEHQTRPSNVMSESEVWSQVLNPDLPDLGDEDYVADYDLGTLTPNNELYESVNMGSNQGSEQKKKKKKRSKGQIDVKKISSKHFGS